MMIDFIEPEGIIDANCAHCSRLLPRDRLHWTGQTYVCADDRECYEAMIDQASGPKKHVWILTDRDLNDALNLKTDARYGSNDAVIRYLERRRKDAWL